VLSKELTLPEPDEIEISIFGPGFGEALTIHMGGGQWILVDSCKDPLSDLPATMQYLLSLNIEVSTAVKLIAATHWHDDHIQGISRILNACHSAKFVVSSALTPKEFGKLLSLYYERPLVKNSGLDEFIQIRKILEERKKPKARYNSPILASSDKLLYRANIPVDNHLIKVNVFSLSPSDAGILYSQLAFGKLFPEANEHPKKITAFLPNHSSVVLWIEIGPHKILLGADLEVTQDSNDGWTAILDESTATTNDANIFKIPHHGSENGHHDGVWTKLLSNNPVAILTPFSRGKKPLPSRADIERITRLTPFAYATAPAKRSLKKWKQKSVQDFINQSTRSIQSINRGWGHVRLRKKIGDMTDSWQIDLFGDAYKLT